EEDDRGAFFLNRIQPFSVWVEVNVSRAVSWRERDGWRVVRHEFSFLGVEFPDEDFVEPEVDVQDEFPGGVGLDHVGVRPVVATDGEAAGGSTGRLGGADLACRIL